LNHVMWSFNFPSGQLTGSFVSMWAVS